MVHTTGNHPTQISQKHPIYKETSFKNSPTSNVNKLTPNPKTSFFENSNEITKPFNSKHNHPQSKQKFSQFIPLSKIYNNSFYPSHNFRKISNHIYRT